MFIHYVEYFRIKHFLTLTLIAQNYISVIANYKPCKTAVQKSFMIFCIANPKI